MVDSNAPNNASTPSSSGLSSEAPSGLTSTTSSNDSDSSASNHDSSRVSMSEAAKSEATAAALDIATALLVFQKVPAAISSTYSSPSLKGLDYVSRKRQNGDLETIHRFPLDLAIPVPRISLNNESLQQRLQKSENGPMSLPLNLFAQVLQGGPPPHSAWPRPPPDVSTLFLSWTDSGDLAKTLLDTLFKGIQVLWDCFCPTYTKLDRPTLHRLFFTARPPAPVELQVDMLYLMHQDITGDLQTVAVLAIKPWIDSDGLQELTEFKGRCLHHKVMHDLVTHMDATHAPLSFLFNGVDGLVFERDYSAERYSTGWMARQDFHRAGSRRTLDLLPANLNNMDLFHWKFESDTHDQTVRSFYRLGLYGQTLLSDGDREFWMGYDPDKQDSVDLKAELLDLHRLVNALTVTGACPSSVLSRINDHHASPARPECYFAFGALEKDGNDLARLDYLLICDVTARHKSDAASTYSATVRWLLQPVVLPQWVCVRDDRPGEGIEPGCIYTIDAGLAEILCDDIIEGASEALRQRAYLKLPNMIGPLDTGRPGVALSYPKDDLDFLFLLVQRMLTEQLIWGEEELRARQRGSSNFCSVLPPQLFTLDLAPTKHFMDSCGRREWFCLFCLGTPDRYVGYHVVPDHGPSLSMIMTALDSTANEDVIYEEHPDLHSVVQEVKSFGVHVSHAVDDLKSQARQKLEAMHRLGLTHLSIESSNICVKLRTLPVESLLTESRFELQFVDFKHSRWRLDPSPNYDAIWAITTGSEHSRLEQVFQNFQKVASNWLKSEFTTSTED